MWPRMHACSLQISRMASGDEPRLNTFGCPGMATGSMYSSAAPAPVQRDAAAQARGAARRAKLAYKFERTLCHPSVREQYSRPFGL